MTFIGVIILSPDSVLIRLADADSWTVLFWRGLLMSIGVTILLLFTYRSKTIDEFKKVGRGGLWIGWLHGIMTGTFVFAIMLTSIANTLVIISTGPIWIAIISWVTLREKASLITWVAMIIVFIGIYIVMSANFGGQNLVGDLFALITAVLMGFTFTLVRKYKTINMVPTMAIGGIIGVRLASVNFHEIAKYLKDAVFGALLVVSAFALVATLTAFVLDVQFLRMLLAFIPGGFYEVTLLSLIFGFDVAFVAFHHSIRVVLVFLLLPLTVSKKRKKV